MIRLKLLAIGVLRIDRQNNVQCAIDGNKDRL